MPTSNVWPLNNNGELVLKTGKGTNTPSTFLSQDFLPISDAGYVPVKIYDGLDSNELPQQTLADWVNGGVLSKISSNSGESVAVDYDKLIDGKPSLRVTTSTGTFQCEFVLTKPISMGGFNSFDLPVFLPYNHGQMFSGSVVQLWVYGSNAEQYRPQFTNESVPPNMWYRISLGRDATYAGTNTAAYLDDYLVTKVRIVVTVGSQAGTFWLGPVSANRRWKKGGVIIYADGQYDSQRDYLLPLLDRYGLSANLALTWKDIGLAGRMTYSELDAAYANGHNIVNHTYGPAATGWDNATDWPDSLTIANSLKGAWAEMQSRGWTRGVGHQVVGYTTGFNAGSTSATKQKIQEGLIAGGVKTLRQGGRYGASAGSVGGLYSPQAAGIPYKYVFGGNMSTNTDTQATIKAFFDAAARRGQIATWTLHRIVANSSTPASLEIKQSDAAACIEYLADLVRNGSVNLLSPSDIAY